MAVGSCLHLPFSASVDFFALEALRPATLGSGTVLGAATRGLPANRGILAAFEVMTTRKGSVVSYDPPIPTSGNAAHELNKRNTLAKERATSRRTTLHRGPHSCLL